MAVTTGALLSNYEEALKEFYLQPVQDQLNNDTILMSILGPRVNETDIAGKEAVIDCHYGRTTGTGSRPDGGTLPTPGYQKYKTTKVPMKYHYGRVQFTGPTIAATRNDRGAFVRVIESEINGLVSDIKQETNRQMWGCGYGVIARWNATGGATSYNLERAYKDNSAGGDGFGSTFGAKYLKENNSAVPVVLTVAASVITTATVATTNIAVSAITEAKASGYDTITCTNPSVTEAAGTFYVRPASLTTYNASTNDGTARLEMMGLRGIVSDNNPNQVALFTATAAEVPSSSSDGLQSLSAGTYTWWKAIVKTHSSGRYKGQRPIDFDLMQEAFDDVEIAAGKDYGPDLMLTTHAIRREYIALCRADRRQINTMTLEGGWSAIEYNGIPFTVDRDAIDGEIYFLTTGDLEMYRMSDWEWMQKDGAILSRVANADAYEGTMFRYAEFGCRRRNSQLVLCDLYYT